MMFVTVGAQMPFDRLVRAVDRWAGQRHKTDVFAQMGPTAYRPKNIKGTRFLEPGEFRRRAESAAVIIAHAGMGSIITALELGKPIIVMPRRGDLAETRNDHQIATAEHFRRDGRVGVAFNDEDLFEKLDNADLVQPTDPIARVAPRHLLDAIRAFIDEQEPDNRRAAARIRCNPGVTKP